MRLAFHACSQQRLYVHNNSVSRIQKMKWPLAALWISLGLHGALIALVHIAPRATHTSKGTIEARLVFTQPPAVPEIIPGIPSAETLDVAPMEPAPLDKEKPPAAPSTELPPSPASFLPLEPAIPRLEIPLNVDLNYYPARELDQTPRGDIPDPEFPDTVAGKIKFQLKIEESGRVSEVSVISAEPADIFVTAVLDRATEALRGTQFKPGIKNGRPVRALVIYELTINPVMPANDGRN